MSPGMTKYNIPLVDVTGAGAAQVSILRTGVLTQVKFSLVCILGGTGAGVKAVEGIELARSSVPQFGINGADNAGIVRTLVSATANATDVTTLPATNEELSVAFPVNLGDILYVNTQHLDGSGQTVTGYVELWVRE